MRGRRSTPLQRPPCTDHLARKRAMQNQKKRRPHRSRRFPSRENESAVTSGSARRPCSTRPSCGCLRASSPRSRGFELRPASRWSGCRSATHPPSWPVRGPPKSRAAAESRVASRISAPASSTVSARNTGEMKVSGDSSTTRSTAASRPGSSAKRRTCPGWSVIPPARWAFSNEPPTF